MNYTTIEQSKALVEAGLNPETADMWYGEVYEGFIDENGIYSQKSEPYYCISLTKPSLSNYSIDQIRDIPCWSTDALIDLLPEVVYGPYPPDHPTKLLIYKHNSKKVIFYFDETGMQHGEEFLSDSLIDSCYAAVLWLLKNGYIEKKGE